VNEIDEAKLQQSLDGAFAPGQLPFCHEQGYKLRFGDRWLCSLSEAELQRCPAFKQACATLQPEPEPSRSSGDGLGLLSAIANILFWVLIGVLVMALIVALKRMLDGRRDTADVAAERKSLEPQAEAAPALLPSGDTDVTRLLDKARRAAERGELGPAIDAAHAAAVQGLAAAGQVEVDRDRTNGDYLRELRKDPPTQQEFRAIVGRVEAAQFGGAAPSRGTFDQVHEQVLALLRRLAVLSLWLLAGAALLGCGKSGGGGAEREELSPRGLHTLRRILSDQGSKVHLRVAPLTKIGEEVGLVVVFPAELEEAQLKRLVQWVHEGGSVVVVGQHTELEEEAEIEVTHQDCGHAAQRGPMQEQSPLTLRVLGDRSLALKPKSETLITHRVEATCGGKPYVVTAFFNEGSITFLPEYELLSNASLSVADNARLVAEQLAVPYATVELVGPWTGDGSQSPLQSIKAAGLGPVVLQLLALAALIALRQGTSFGARRDVLRRTRRAFADHVSAVAANYARARAGRLVSGHYGLFLIDQLRERVCPGQKPTLFQLAAALARRVRRPETEIVRLLVEAKSAFDEHGDGQVINHKVIRELEQLSLQAGGIA
jgi:hypothetical protein